MTDVGSSLHDRCASILAASRRFQMTRSYIGACGLLGRRLLAGSFCFAIDSSLGGVAWLLGDARARDYIDWLTGRSGKQAAGCAVTRRPADSQAVPAATDVAVTILTSCRRISQHSVVGVIAAFMFTTTFVIARHRNNLALAFSCQTT